MKKMNRAAALEFCWDCLLLPLYYPAWFCLWFLLLTGPPTLPQSLLLPAPQPPAAGFARH